MVLASRGGSLVYVKLERGGRKRLVRIRRRRRTSVEGGEAGEVSAAGVAIVKACGRAQCSNRIFVALPEPGRP